MKRTVCLMLALVFLLVGAGCGGNSGASHSSATSATVPVENKVPSASDVKNAIIELGFDLNNVELNDFGIWYDQEIAAGIFAEEELRLRADQNTNDNLYEGRFELNFYRFADDSTAEQVFSTIRGLDDYFPGGNSVTEKVIEDDYSRVEIEGEYITGAKAAVIICRLENTVTMVEISDLYDRPLVNELLSGLGY